jgi:hypothetical protein
LLPAQRDLHNSLTYYLADQKTCIDELKKISDSLPTIIESIAQKHQIDGCFSVFLFGSMARFEYLPTAKVSSIGILPIFKSQQDVSEDKIDNVLDDLKSEIEKIFKSEKSNLYVDIHAIKTGDRTYFSAEDELIELIGKEYERCWSSIERAGLLWEAVYMKGGSDDSLPSAFHKKLREKLLNVCGCLEDLKDGRFPTLLYVFSQEVLVQGLANEFRKLKGKIVNDNITPQEQEQIRLMFSRFVGIKVKQLALHLIFWIRQKDEKCLSKDPDGDIKEENDKYLNLVLNRPPIILGLNGLKKLVSVLTNVSNDDQKIGRLDFVSWLKKLIFSREEIKKYKIRQEDITQREKTIKQIEDVFNDLKNCLQFPKKEEKDFSVGEFMLDLWYQYRKSKYELTTFETNYIEKLGEQTWKMVEITGRAAWITQQLETIRLQTMLYEQGALDFYDKSWYLLRPAIFPEYRKDSNTVETELKGVKMPETKTESTGGKMPENSPIRIFISHSHADRQIAKKLVEYLLAALRIEDNDIRCTSVPGYQLPPGTNIEEHLRKDISDDIALVGLLTEHGLRSQWVLFELGAAWVMRKRVIPILGSGLKGEDLPGPLKSLTFISIEDEQVAYSLNDMIDTLATYLAVEQKLGANKESKRNEFIEQLNKSNTPPAN